MSIFNFIGFKHFDTIVGYSECILSLHKNFHSSKIRILMSLFDNGIIFEGITALHLEFIKRRKWSNLLIYPKN